jgi:hypothetical protein
LLGNFARQIDGGIERKAPRELPKGHGILKVATWLESI